MINIILAVDSNFGIGKEGKLPWNISEELNIFKEKTMNAVLIMGRKTVEHLPKLKDRLLFCVSRQIVISDNNFIINTKSIEEALKEAKATGKKVFIAGGAQVYNHFFSNIEKYPDVNLHISILKGEYSCDTRLDKSILRHFYVVNKIDYPEFVHYEMVYRKYGESEYLELLKDILKNGERRIGRNGEVISDFCKHLKFDLRNGFPLLTTKKMFLKGIIEELLFFIRGDTDTQKLEEKGINIWKGNTSREFLDANGFKGRQEGEMGPMYGSIWRNFNGLTSKKEKQVLKDSKKCEFHYKSYNLDGMSYDTDTIESIDFGIDQIKYIINEIQTNPTSRRILLTTYNPGQVKQGVLYPCHSITIQFYVQDEFLDMFCYNRSSDVFLGLPFNIASSSLFLMIIAQLTNLKPRYFNLSLGDVHIYGLHEESVLKQIERIPYTFPQINLPNFTTLEDIEKLTYKDFTIEKYNYYDSIKAPMVA